MVFHPCDQELWWIHLTANCAICVGTGLCSEASRQIIFLKDVKALESSRFDQSRFFGFFLTESFTFVSVSVRDHVVVLRRRHY